MGPDTKKHDSDRTNKQTSFIPLFAVLTELSSDTSGTRASPSPFLGSSCYKNTTINIFVYQKRIDTMPKS